MARSEYQASNDIASHVVGNIAQGMHMQSERERFARVLSRPAQRRIAQRRSLIRRIFGI